MKLSKYQLLEYMVSCIYEVYSEINNKQYEFKIVYQCNNNLYVFNTCSIQDGTVKLTTIKDNSLTEETFMVNNCKYIETIRTFVNDYIFSRYLFKKLVANPVQMLDFCLKFINEEFPDLSEQLTYLYNFKQLDSNIQFETYLNTSDFNFVPVSLTVEQVEHLQS